MLDGYIRVSQVAGREGERFISPSVQREQIEGWVKAHGATLANVYEELDESGARGDRPLLMEALERVEEGESGGVVVAKLDRFGRSVVDGLSAIRRIEKAGGTFVSVQDGFDIGTSTGRLVLQVLFSIGEWELERVRANWNTARQRAIDRGLFLSHVAPFGYKRGEDGRLHVDPKEAPFVREAFERRARGETLSEIATFFNDAGLRTPISGRPYDQVAIGQMLSKPTYLGESRSGEYSNPTAHEAIVDPALWQLCRRPKVRPREGTEALLKGRIRCAGCGALMTPRRSVPRLRVQHTYYRCHAKNARCPAPAVARASDIEPLVEEFIFRKTTRRRKPPRVPIREAELLLEQAEKDLAAYRDAPGVLRRLGTEGFEAGLEARKNRVDQRLAELGNLRRAQEGPRVDVQELERRWPEMSWRERHAAVRELVDLVVVERGNGAVVDRAWLYGRGKGPRLSEPNRSPVPLPRRKGAASLKYPAVWSEKEIESGLRAFLGDRDEWPEFLHFARAGRARLCAQAWSWGGPYYWAHKLNISVPDGTVRWSDEYVANALRPILKGRTRWPERREFIEIGLEALHRALNYHGGRSHWAELHGLQYTPRNKATWTKDRIEKELRSFFGDLQFFPTKPQFEAARKRALYAAVLRLGGIEYWADRVGRPVSVGAIDQRG